MPLDNNKTSNSF